MTNNTNNSCRQQMPMIESLQGNRNLDLFLSYVWNFSLENEVWKEIKGFDEMYYVSNLGRILSLKRNKYRELHPFVCGDGYYYVDLRKNNQDSKQRVHRLVANAFVPNPENKPIVHHLDCNRLNNKASNLVFVSQIEHQSIHNKAQKL